MAQPAKRRPTTARWGWSGGAIVRSSEGECTSVTGASRSIDLGTIATQLRPVQSTAAQIEAEFYSMRASFHRYLRQDEFGPSRAEQLCALRNLHYLVHRSIGIFEQLSEVLREKLHEEIARIEAFAPVTWFDDKDIRALSLGATRLLSRTPQHQFEGSGQLQDLIVTLNALIAGIRLLDTNTQAGFLFCERSRACREQLARPMEEVGVLAAALEILRTELQVRIQALEAVRGPDGQRSLGWLVYRLCDLWRRETGRGVDSIGWKDNAFNDSPSSPCAKFVAAVVEAFQPDKSWCESQPVAHKSVLVFTEDRAHRARRIHYLMRAYVRNLEQAAVRRRRPRGL